MKFSNVIKYYKRKDVQERILEVCKDREVIPRYWNGGFGKRPDTIMFKNDVNRFVRDGATSFHTSEERWTNPLDLSTNMNRAQMDELRSGWDFILDIDPKNWEYGRICAKLLVEALESHGVKSYSIKFSGGKGWHVGVPWEAFPKMINKKEVRKLFPEASRTLAAYLKDLIKEHLRRELLALEDSSLKRISKRAGVKQEELFVNNEFDPYSVIEVDTILISPRHLYRTPYSFNEKTWLVSIPMTKQGLDEFSLDHAKPENVKTSHGFFDKKASPGEAENLMVQAMDWAQKNVVKEDVSVERDYELPEKAVNKEMFPPCIQLILKGLSDGRKRSVFILNNFLKTQGWENHDIKRELLNWNKKNEESLPEQYINSQLNWSKKNKDERFPPPNCDNKSYYVDIGVCKPDHFCKRIKNPSSYPFFKTRSLRKRSSAKH